MSEFDNVRKAVEASLPPRKVLLVEDDLEASAAIEQLLSLHGMEVTVAATAEDGLQKFRSSRFNLLLIDFKLPGQMDGIDMLARVREIDTRIPVFIITGYLEHKKIGEIPRYKWATVVGKPIDDPKLIDILKSVR